MNSLKLYKFENWVLMRLIINHGLSDKIPAFRKKCFEEVMAKREANKIKEMNKESTL